MNTSDTEMGGGENGPGGRFPRTSWSILARIREPDPDRRRRALERLVSGYWKPIYCWIRHTWGKGNEDAKDLAQEFFVHLIEGGLVEKFAPERGSFRGFLRAALKHFLLDTDKAAARVKRGGDRRHLPLDFGEFDLAEILPDARTLTPDQAFDAAWRSLVLAQGVEKLKQRLLAEGKPDVFEVFRRYDLEPAGEPSYGTVAEALGLTPDTVKNHLTRARRCFREAVLGAMMDTVESEADLAAEMEQLFG